VVVYIDILTTAHTFIYTKHIMTRTAPSRGGRGKNRRGFGAKEEMDVS